MKRYLTMVHEDFIKENYNSYTTYLAARKVVVSPFLISEPKDNHRSSLYAETKLTKKQEWYDVGKVFEFLCQIRNIHTNLPDDKPRIIVTTGNIPFDYGEDPINGLNF